MTLTAVASQPLAKELDGALPETDPDVATAMRVALDARFCPTVGRWTNLAVRRLGLRRPARRALRLVMTSVAGELTVEIDADASPAVAALCMMASGAKGEACAAALATGWLQHFAQDMPARDLELRVLRAAPLDREPTAVDPLPTLALDGLDVNVCAMDAAFGLFASEEMALSPTPSDESWPSALLLTPSIVVAAREIPCALVRAVRAGDVFLAGPLPLAAKWRLGLQRGRSADVRIESLAAPATLTTLPLPYEDAMDDTDRRTNATEPLDDIEIPVTFEIDAESIDLATLRGLAPGQVVATRQRLESATVRLRSNGRAIGRGQLIAVGGFLGVKIEQMAWSRNDAPAA